MPGAHPPAAGSEALSEHDGVHRAGACAAHPFDLDPTVFQQAIKHAPSKRTVRRSYGTPLRDSVKTTANIPRRVYASAQSVPDGRGTIAATISFCAQRESP